MRLHQIGAVAVALVALLPLRPLGGEELADAPFPPGRGEALGELGEDRLLAGQEAGLQQRRLHRGVGARILQAFGDGTGGVADLQPQVPEQVEHELHHPLPAGAQRLAGDEEQVDVAEGRQHAAAIAAGGGQGEGGLALRLSHHGETVVVDRADQPVHQRAEAAAGDQPGQGARLELLLHAGLHPAEAAAQQQQRGVAGNGGARLHPAAGARRGKQSIDQGLHVLRGAGCRGVLAVAEEFHQREDRMGWGDLTVTSAAPARLLSR